MPHRSPIKWEYQLHKFIEFDLPHEQEVFNAWSRRNRKKRTADQNKWRSSHREAHLKQCRQDEARYLKRKREEADMQIEEAEQIQIPQGEELTYEQRRAIMRRYADGAHCTKQIRAIMEICYKLGFRHGEQTMLEMIEDNC